MINMSQMMGSATEDQLTRSILSHRWERVTVWLLMVAAVAFLARIRGPDPGPGLAELDARLVPVAELDHLGDLRN